MEKMLQSNEVEMTGNRDMRECNSCNREVLNDDMVWVNDRYGVPWKKVCPQCVEQTEREISAYRFDPADAGENLEPEDY